MTARLHLVVKPRSSKEGFARDGTGVLVLKVNAPPVDGAANGRVVVVVAKALGLSKSQVLLVRGETSRHKELLIEGINEDELPGLLTHLLEQP